MGSTFGATWEDPGGGFIKFAVTRALKQDQIVHMEVKFQVILYFSREWFMVWAQVESSCQNEPKCPNFEKLHMIHPRYIWSSTSYAGTKVSSKKGGRKKKRYIYLKIFLQSIFGRFFVCPKNFSIDVKRCFVLLFSFVGKK